MRIKRGLRQAVLSAIVFVGIMLALVSVDVRVRDRITEIVAGGEGLTMGQQIAEVGTALIASARYQSIENAPLVVFATVGAVLFFFMLKT